MAKWKPLLEVLGITAGYFIGVFLVQLATGKPIPSTQEELIAAGAALLLGLPTSFFILRRLLRGWGERPAPRWAAGLVEGVLLFFSISLSLVMALFSHQGLLGLLYEVGLGNQLGFLAHDDLLRTLFLFLFYLWPLSLMARFAIGADGYRYLRDLIVIPAGASSERLSRSIQRRISAFDFLLMASFLLVGSFFLVLRLHRQEVILQSGILQGQGLWPLLDADTALPLLFLLGYALFLKNAPLAVLLKDPMERAAADLRQEGVPFNYTQSAAQGPGPAGALGVSALAAAIGVAVCGMIYAGISLLTS